MHFLTSFCKIPRPTFASRDALQSIAAQPRKQEDEDDDFDEQLRELEVEQKSSKLTGSGASIVMVVYRDCSLLLGSF